MFGEEQNTCKLLSLRKHTLKMLVYHEDRLPARAGNSMKKSNSYTILWDNLVRGRTVGLSCHILVGSQHLSSPSIP